MNKLILCCITVLTFSFAYGQKSRSAETGRYVSKKYATDNPKTTVTEGKKTKSTSSPNTSGYSSSGTGSNRSSGRKK